VLLPQERKVHASAARPLETGRQLEPAIPRVGRIFKRVLDLVGSVLLLVLCAPLLAALAVLIKCQDGGPVFFRRRVVGPRGAFDAFKLRSMRIDADEVLRQNSTLRQQFEINFKLKDDPRVTTVGAILRKASLDELPQLWNVLKGEMSLVGPRMVTPAELTKYGEAEWIFRCVKPGLTGYWQVQGRQQVSYDRRIEMDLFYLQHWSFLLDLKILVKTPLRVFRGVGAY
jgi:lipopolysaccharide/colanic/teichoic acid biosynthesis glycosyltransferase